MLVVRWEKTLVLFILFLLPLIGKAQYNAYHFDDKFKNKPLHFGILLGLNQADFRIYKSQNFLIDDTIRSVESEKGPGFTLGIISNLRLSDHFDLRLLPTMTFTERNLNYQTWQDTFHTQSVEFINFEVPLLLKFKSNPYKDMRLYVIGGAKYSYDLASNAKARNAEHLVKISPHDVHLEYGIGMEIYFPMFILAPEIRISQGMFDIHSLDPDLQYSNVLQRLMSRMVVLTFNFEG